MKRIRSVVVVGLVAVLFAGCSLVPTADSPIVINRKPFPYGLLGKSIPGTLNGHVRFITQPVFIVDATGHLTPSSRIVPSPPNLDSVLSELVLGPTNIETFTGYTSALPKNLVILQATIQNDVGFVALADPLSSLPRSQQILAIGQLVYTAHGVGALNGLEILVAGVAQSLLKPNGEKALRVSEHDYRSLLNS